MRLESTRPGNPVKWFDLDIMPLANDQYAVVMSYGLKTPSGEDSILQNLRCVYQGDYTTAENVLLAKISNRESFGYKRIEPKQEA